MKTVLTLFSVLLLLAGCRQQKNDPSDLVAADISFSRMSVEKGLNAAFIHFAADSVVKMREGRFPITGKDEMSRIYRSRPDTGIILKWKPVKAEISRSNDLGYTFGEWELYDKSRDTTMYGNYISVWKKQADGTWKYILDAGCNTPKPSSTSEHR